MQRHEHPGWAGLVPACRNRSRLLLSPYTNGAPLDTSAILYNIVVHVQYKAAMGTTMTYSQAREHLAEVWDRIEDGREEAILTRRGHEDMAILPAAELASLKETAYLLRSPANAARLLTALARSRRGDAPEPTDLAALRREIGLSTPGE